MAAKKKKKKSKAKAALHKTMRTMASLESVRHRAYCNTCGKAVGSWGDEEIAEADAERHLISRPSHDVQIVTQQTSAKTFSL